MVRPSASQRSGHFLRLVGVVVYYAGDCDLVADNEEARRLQPDNQRLLSSRGGITDAELIPGCGYSSCGLPGG